jgi:hypothetical protein
MIDVKTKCPCCGCENVVSMTDEQYIEYSAGYKNIQFIFPDWSAEKRELLISGVCPKCWRNIFDISADDLVA